MDCTALKEYFEILSIVADFDQRLLTIKSWGITFSLATLALGVQKRHRGLLLVATLSSLSFWALEGTTKGHQMRYYPRMREIEVACAGQGGPRIDTSWSEALSPPSRLDQSPSAPTSRRLGREYWLRWFFPAVMIPHVFTLAVSMWLAWKVPRQRSSDG
jgi:uncharacterized membrane protein